LVAGGWKALKPATIKQKAKLGYTKKLVRTGELKNSFTPFSTKDIASVRSDLDYAADHEFGVPSRNLPARKMTPSLKQAAEIGIEVYNQFVQRQIKKVGFK
jgi:phage gpG-like protein